MGRIFYIVGKSASGKDSIYNILKEDKSLNLKTIVPYTTRPIRDGEEEGVQYHFVDNDKFSELDKEGVVIEQRVYDTVHGKWRYFTVDDGSIDLAVSSYIAIGVLASFASVKDYFGQDKVVPIYIDVDDGERLKRALHRELKPENRKFSEMCRRYLADEEDFSEDKIKKLGICAENRFENDDLDRCINAIKEYIKAR